MEAYDPSFRDDLCSALLRVLSSDGHSPDSTCCLDPAFRADLIAEEPSTGTGDDSKQDPPSDFFVQEFANPPSAPFTPQGIPPRPFHKLLAHRLALWAALKQFPIKFADLSGFEKSINHAKRDVVLSHTDAVIELHKQWNASPKPTSSVVSAPVPHPSSFWDALFCCAHSAPAGHSAVEDEAVDEKKTAHYQAQDASALPWPIGSKEDRLHRLLQGLGARGVVGLLGMQCTLGSIERLPPSRARLLAAFNVRHQPKSAALLSVGARALSKHYHRGADRWWTDGMGELSGNDVKKNAMALQMLSRFTEHAVWVNVHGLPHDVYVFELRVAEGYGVRWMVAKDDSMEFRGFLEPTMENGHEKGWKH